jgi:hypothetical protein
MTLNLSCLIRKTNAEEMSLGVSVGVSLDSPDESGSRPSGRESHVIFGSDIILPDLDGFTVCEMLHGADDSKYRLPYDDLPWRADIQTQRPL